jgi:RsiW-degrading membrane proteinase PrsW (M82 family)
MRLSLNRIASIGLSLTVLLFLLQLPFFFSAGIVKASSNLIYHAFVFTWILALFWKRFTISPRTAINFWFVGIYPVLLLSLLISLPIAAIFGLDSPFVYFFWVPITEEAAKILPVALYLWFLYRTNRWQPSASDGLLLGWLVGAGFTFHEDAMMKRVFGEGWFASRYSPLLPTIIGSHGAFQAGHAVWTAFLGMAIAFAFLYWKHRFARIAPIFVFALVVLDHVRVNVPPGNPFFVQWLRWMLGDGQVTIILFLSAIVTVFLIEGRLLAGRARLDWLFSEVSFKGAIKPGSFISKLRQLPNILNYQRLRRAAYYRFWQWNGNGVFERSNEMAATLVALAETIGLRLENKFEEVLTMSVPADRKIYPSGSTESAVTGSGNNGT